MSYILSFWCRLRGHVWRRNRNGIAKQCKVCGEVRQIVKRKKELQ